jgi:glyoxylase-like metal-dependent hydrolase (beta-lactamase superfamily II)
MMDVQAGWFDLEVPEVAEPDENLADGYSLQLGATDATILHTPGHTQGSICLYVPSQSLLLAGDTLFAGSIGRTDLPGGDSEQLLRSIHSTLLALPDTTQVIPGHGGPTSIGRERQSNPWLRGI